MSPEVDYDGELECPRGYLSPTTFRSPSRFSQKVFDTGSPSAERASASRTITVLPTFSGRLSLLSLESPDRKQRVKHEEHTNKACTAYGQHGNCSTVPPAAETDNQVCPVSTSPKLPELPKRPFLPTRVLSDVGLARSDRMLSVDWSQHCPIDSPSSGTSSKSARASKLGNGPRDPWRPSHSESSSPTNSEVFRAKTSESDPSRRHSLEGLRHTVLRKSSEREHQNPTSQENEYPGASPDADHEDAESSSSDCLNWEEVEMCCKNMDYASLKVEDIDMQIIATEEGDQFVYRIKFEGVEGWHYPHHDEVETILARS